MSDSPFALKSGAFIISKSLKPLQCLLFSPKNVTTKATEVLRQKRQEGS
jgi:hypothetical protein